VYCGDNEKPVLPVEVELDLDHDVREKKKVKGTVLRIVRDSKLAWDIKKLYQHKCQVCGTAIPTKHGHYSEGAHIKPLGKPHNGDDSLANLLCLCPNHHVMLDKGSISITDDFKLLGSESGVLFVHEKHKIDKKNLKYHRECYEYN